MPAPLTEFEARILGSLVEKCRTTPEQYPLSLKALTAACNQKTSRDPVMELDEAVVGKSLYPLIQRGLVEQRFEVGNRVPKFAHRIRELLKTDEPKIIGALCVLLLRGPQTPGEIKGRTERLCEFASTAEVEALLQQLCAAEDPMVAQAARQPGQKENRYRHLFIAAEAAGPAAAAAAAQAPAGNAPASIPTPQNGKPAADPAELVRRIEALEARVASLESRSAS